MNLLRWWFCICFAQFGDHVFFQCLSFVVPWLLHYNWCGVRGGVGGVVICNALVLFVVPPQSICACRCRIYKCCCCACQVCLVWLGALLGFPWDPKPAATPMEVSLVASLGAVVFKTCEAPCCCRLPILHQDSVFDIYGNQCFPCPRFVVRKCSSAIVRFRMTLRPGFSPRYVFAFFWKKIRECTKSIMYEKGLSVKRH